MRKDINLTVRILKAGSNEKRIKILEILLSGEEFTVEEIANRINLSISATSKHLNKLESVRLIKKRKTSRWVWYSLNQDKRKRFNSLFFEFLKKALL